MFSHPLTGIGKICIILGVLLAAYAIATNGNQTAVALAGSAVLEGLGFFFVLIGVIAQGFLRIERYLVGIPEMKAAFDATAPKAAAETNPYQKRAAQK